MGVASGVNDAANDTQPRRLRDALRQARIEAADRTGVVVDLRDAVGRLRERDLHRGVRRLELLQRALQLLPLELQVVALGRELARVV